NNHFSDTIQSRSYRSPEVILRWGYGPSADIWSTACMAFELATQQNLFPVREDTAGKFYTKDEIHLGSIVGLLGDVPEWLAFSSRHARKLFTANGKLCHFPKSCCLFELLTETHCWDVNEARGFCDFLLPMLAIDPNNGFRLEIVSGTSG
uniref:non-specific serine/threonine protein kinase n=1 Tax=Strigamia maritima TaxID=126957 RepID=T1JHU3_STRMM